MDGGNVHVSVNSVLIRNNNCDGRVSARTVYSFVYRLHSSVVFPRFNFAPSVYFIFEIIYCL